MPNSPAPLLPMPRHRLACDADLTLGATVTLGEGPAHYLGHVVRVPVGDAIALFNPQQGEVIARIAAISKRSIACVVEAQRRPPEAPLGLTVAFAPIKGGRLETILEKATELGATALQPVLTQRTIVDKINPARAELLLREAAEQCERIAWPTLHPPMKFAAFVAAWPSTQPLLYGDETGQGEPLPHFLARTPAPAAWGIFAGPEGGFTPDEFAALRHLPHAHNVTLGPRILRADTALITLSALTLAAWGDWEQRPRFGA